YSREKLLEGVNITTLLTDVNICSSKSEVRRLVEQNGISINDSKVTDFNAIIKYDKDFIVRKGKKVIIKIKLI
ncbi:MAG: S4 domain-containing protein, partial [Clostridia bacterium]